MKKLSLVLLALCPLCLIGCNNDGGSSNEPGPSSLDYEALKNFGDSFKMTLNLDGDMPLGKDLPTAKMTSRSAFESNGKLHYENYSSKQEIVGTKQEAANYLTAQMGSEVKVDALAETLDYLVGKGIKSYKIDNDTVTVVMSEYDDETYYDYTDSNFLPTTWSKDTNPKSSTYGKFVGTTSFWNQFSLDIDDDLFDHLKDFAYDQKTGTITVTQDQAIQYDLIDEDVTLEKFEIHVNESNQVTSMEQIMSQGDTRQVATSTFEYTSNLALPDASQRAPLCAHTHIEEGYSVIELDDGYYHFHTCEDCGSHVEVEKCVFDDQGHCETCNYEKTTIIKLVGDEFHEPIVYLQVNAVTNKIVYVGITDYPEALDKQHEDLDISSDYLMFDNFECTATDGCYVNYAFSIGYEGVLYVVANATDMSTGDVVFFFFADCFIDSREGMGEFGPETTLEITFTEYHAYVVDEVYNG